MSKSKFVAALMVAALSWGTFTLAAVPSSQEQQSQWNSDSAKDLRAKAYYAKTKADELKASVSQKSEYDELITQFKAGDENYLAGNYTAAVQSYLTVLEGFASLCAKTARAKDEATVAVEDAKERVAQSEQEALKADQIKPLGDEPVEGIEDHDAKMLEDDDFSGAENTAVEISPTIDEEEDTQEQGITESETVKTEDTVPQDGESAPDDTSGTQETTEQNSTLDETQTETDDTAESEAATESDDATPQEVSKSESAAESEDEGNKGSSDSTQQDSAQTANEKHSAASTQEGAETGADEESDFAQIEIEFYEDIEESELEEK